MPISSVTIGLEIENFTAKQASPEAIESYDRLVTEEKKARVINDLGLGDYFPVEAEKTTRLCTIKKFDGTEYQDFLSVSFDTHSAKTMLEFASIGSPPNGGILDHRKFFTKENLGDIRESIDAFASRIKQMRAAATAEASSSSALSKFQFQFSDHARDFLSKPLGMDKGMIHVTHSFDVNTTPEQCKEFLTFANPRSTRNSREGEALRSIVDLSPGYLELTTSKRYDNGYRDSNSPNPKTPKELLTLKGGTIICPMSNVVEDAQKDLMVYENVISMIDRKIKEVPEAVQEFTAAKAKLENTMTVVREGIAGKGNKQYVFPTIVEDKLKPPLDDDLVLLEHRNGKIVEFVTACIRQSKFDATVVEQICNELDKVGPKFILLSQAEELTLPAHFLVATQRDIPPPPPLKQGPVRLFAPLPFSNASGLVQAHPVLSNLPDNVADQVLAAGADILDNQTTPPQRTSPLPLPPPKQGPVRLFNTLNRT